MTGQLQVARDGYAQEAMISVLCSSAYGALETRKTRRAERGLGVRE